MLVHHIQLDFESNPSWALLKNDMSNAFNSVNRSNLLQQVESSFPEILNHVKQMYANVGHLVYQMGEETVLINSEGVHQGDQLGPVLFSLKIHPVLKQLQLQHDKGRVLVYLDDIFLLGEPDATVTAALHLKSSLTPLGLSICDQKYELFTPDRLNTKHCPFQVTNDGTMVLGIPVGSSSFVFSKSEDIAHSGQSLCSALSQLEDPQSECFLLRHCHVPKLNYLARSVSPSLFQSTAEIHDNMTRRTFCKILGVPSRVDERWKEATLPIKLGGFVMTSVDAIASSAFLGGWMHTLSNLPTRFPHLTIDVSLLLATDNVSKILADIH